jgi:lipid-A-disaccharide synthase
VSSGPDNYICLEQEVTLRGQSGRYNGLVRILISAGEASGEMYGAQLIEALRRKNPSLEFFGVGGEKMRAAGCHTVIDAKDLSVVGITEILSHLPKIWGLFHKLIAEADRRKPDLAIVIDSPAFNWRVARQMKKRGISVVYYVCPQFWAWRQGRVRLLRKYVDKALVIFPFEEKFYRDRGVDAEFVGHPLSELPRPAITRGEYATQHGLDPGKQWITLMPGSRAKEVRMNVPGILEAVTLLGSVYEFLLPVAPTLDRRFVEQLLKDASQSALDGAGEGTRPYTRVGPNAPVRAANRVHLVPEALPALSHSRAGIIASGTATVEAAIMETPFVMVYRVTPLTYLLGRSTVKVPHFAMVNLIAGERVVPELVQQDFTAERVAAEINRIIPDGSEREKMLEKFGKVRSQLRGGSGDVHPADRAAGAVLEFLRPRVCRPSGTHSFPTPTQG